jgi:glutathione peroxidase
MTTISDFHATSIDGRDVDLASYAGLQRLFDDYGDQGLVVLGFPCDQFGHQEPGTEDEIDAFCQQNYGVSFPMFAKIEVNGDDTHPLYQWLKHKKSGLVGNDIRWNFTKFLVGRDGRVVKRFGPAKDPESLRPRIEKALAEPED